MTSGVGCMALDTALVRRLLTAQMPQWAALPLVTVAATGTDHAIFRLGGDMVVRLPRVERVAGQAEKEWRWLPWLAQHLPLPIPVPIARGTPGEQYPWGWGVYRWLEGESITDPGAVDAVRVAEDLAGFIRAMHSLEAAAAGPRPGEHNFYRGVPLAARDARVRTCIVEARALVDPDVVMRAWEAALAAPAWDGPGVWIHGDLRADNLLCAHRRVCAVIDFGGLGVGDPACDLFIAWDLFTTATRARFREVVQADDATWARARGWALSIAIMALPFYLDSNAAMVQFARRLLRELLADPE